MRCELKSEFRCRHSGTLVEHPARETCIDGAKVVHYPGEVRKRGGEGQKRRGVWHPGGGRRFQQFPAIGRSWKLLEAWGLGENPWKGLAKVELNKIIILFNSGEGKLHFLRKSAVHWRPLPGVGREMRFPPYLPSVSHVSRL